MIFAQKISSLGYSFADGRLSKPEQEKLRGMRKKTIISEFPTVLEYYSYILNFMGILAGPCTFFNEWKEFINKNKGETSTRRYLGLFAFSIFLVASNQACGIFGFKVQNLFDPVWVESTSFFYKLGYLKLFNAFGIRCQFYFAWMISESINVAAGFGFNEESKQWDLLSNVDVVACETSTNSPSDINNWNIRTSKWLRLVCYERAPRQFSTVLTFSLSALWHGFFPGYYYLFAQGHCLTVVHRRFKKSGFLDWVQDQGVLAHRSFQLLSWFGYHAVFDYASACHFLLTQPRCFAWFKSVYFYGHVVVLVLMLVPLSKTSGKDGKVDKKLK